MVAGEVKDLAARTARTAEDVSGLVGDIQMLTTRAGTTRGTREQLSGLARQLNGVVARSTYR